MRLNGMSESVWEWTAIPVSKNKRLNVSNHNGHNGRMFFVAGSKGYCPKITVPANFSAETSTRFGRARGENRRRRVPLIGRIRNG